MHPAMIPMYVPLDVLGDGNCLFRALSRNLYSIPRSRMKSIARPGGFSELLVIFVASAALSIGIQSYCPPTFNTEFLSEPMSRKIYGRGVHKTKATAATIMWSMTFVPQRLNEFRPNHFVVLYPKDKPEQCHIDLTRTPARNNSVHEINDDEWPSLSSTKISSPAMIQHTPVINSDSRRKRIANLKVSPTLHPQPPPTTMNEHCASPDIHLEKSAPSPTTNEHCASPDAPDTSEPQDITTESSEDTSDVASIDTIPPGGVELQGTTNLKIREIVNLIREDSAALPSIPFGRKENCYFKIDNTDNVAKKANGKNCTYYDDCGAWFSGSSSSVIHYLEDISGHLTVIFK